MCQAPYHVHCKFPLFLANSLYIHAKPSLIIQNMSVNHAINSLEIC